MNGARNMAHACIMQHERLNTCIGKGMMFPEVCSKHGKNSEVSIITSDGERAEPVFSWACSRSQKPSRERMYNDHLTGL